ncbi:MAG: hypothetical protein H8F28_08280 [Fibrella sp.]|nr:hypothetical protein [Armatimonadota bacterium]
MPNATPRTGEVFAVGSPGRVDTGSVLNGGSDLYRYEATLSSPVTMVAGAYGISIVNDTTADTDDDWFWATSAQTGTFFVRTTPTGAFESNPSSLAFQLIDSTPVVVPELGTLALVLPALALVGAVVVRRRKQVAAVL